MVNRAQISVVTPLQLQMYFTCNAVKFSNTLFRLAPGAKFIYPNLDCSAYSVSFKNPNSHAYKPHLNSKTGTNIQVGLDLYCFSLYQLFIGEQRQWTFLKYSNLMGDLLDGSPAKIQLLKSIPHLCI